MTNPFLVHVAVLRRVLGTVVDVSLVGTFDEDETTTWARGAARVPSGAQMEVDATITSATGSLRVDGTVRAPWEGLCSRCAIEVRGTIEAGFDELFLERGAGEDAYPIVDDAIDLGPAGREWVVVSLPLLPLCRPDCAGLCPSCGTDRNEATCSCSAPRDDRWAALDALRDDLA